MFTATNLLGVVCQSALIWWRLTLPGLGQSERRNLLLSPKAMGEFVVRVADTVGLEHPHVVGPDVGTGASFFAAALCTQGGSGVLQ